jgi:hypothetical protein
VLPLYCLSSLCASLLLNLAASPCSWCRCQLACFCLPGGMLVCGLFCLPARSLIFPCLPTCPPPCPPVQSGTLSFALHHKPENAQALFATAADAPPGTWEAAAAQLEPTRAQHNQLQQLWHAYAARVGQLR